MAASSGIISLEEIVDSLTPEDKARFQRIFAVTTATGELRLPPGMQSWVKHRFGSETAVTRQKVVRVTNKITCEESLFNRLRALRPNENNEAKDVKKLGSAGVTDMFSRPYENTPEDLFGRVVGRHCVTASNVAKYDGLHGLVIFNDFDPLHFSREQVIDYLDVAREWAKKAQARQPEARYFFFVWNCHWRAGASISHGHAQVLLARGRHYAKIEGLRRAALSYRQSYGTDYFADLFQAHLAVGCAVEKDGIKILAHLTPFKDNETVLIGEELNLSFKERIYEALVCLRDRLGVTSFNLSLATPPLTETEESWDGFPIIVRLVDRGSTSNRASDVGGMELYAASVVASDPFRLAGELADCLHEVEGNG